MSVLSSGLPEEVGDTELVSRLLTSSSWFASTLGVVKPSAFLPAPDHDTSVVRSGNLTDEQLWDVASTMGLKHPDGSPKPIYGAGTVRVEHARRAGLNVISHEPPPCHANLRGWAMDEDMETRKARRKDVANALAAEATLKLMVSPPP